MAWKWIFLKVLRHQIIHAASLLLRLLLLALAALLRHTATLLRVVAIEQHILVAMGWRIFFPNPTQILFGSLQCAEIQFSKIYISRHKAAVVSESFATGHNLRNENCVGAILSLMSRWPKKTVLYHSVESIEWLNESHAIAVRFFPCLEEGLLSTR